jgi:beta-lactamase class A
MRSPAIQCPPVLLRYLVLIAGEAAIDDGDHASQAPAPEAVLDLREDRHVAGVPGPAPHSDRDPLARDGEPDHDLRQLGPVVLAVPEHPEGALTGLGLVALEVGRGRVEEQQVDLEVQEVGAGIHVGSDVLEPTKPLAGRVPYCPFSRPAAAVTGGAAVGPSPLQRAEGTSMGQSRRGFLEGAAAATVGAATLGVPELARATGTDGPELSDRIQRLFAKLPGTNAIKIVAPATRRTRRLQVSVKSSERLFIGSAFKTFVLAEALRQAEPDVVATITGRELALDASVWSPDSATFNPPNLSGKVSERTALEAMILHSDNTGTDMSLKQVGADNVRALIASAGLTNTLIPDATRSFIGYLLGAPDYLTFTWDQYVAAANDPIVNPPLNTTQTLASSADDLVSWYSRALQGQFFKGGAALQEYRAILSIGDIIWLLPLPLGVSAFAKGGSIDVPGFHALCGAGGMFFDDVWVYFCLTINWDAAAQADPATVEAWAAAGSKALQVVKDALSD